MLLFIFFILFSPNVKAIEQEWLMQIVFGSAGPVRAHIILYQGNVEIDDGYSGSTWTFNENSQDWKGNVGSDVHATFESNDSEFLNPPPTWSIKRPGGYTVRIISGTSDRYFYIYIPIVTTQHADFNIRYDIYDGSVSYVNNDRGVSPSSIVSYTWVEYNVSVKNSFNAAGDMDVDYDRVQIPNGGQTYNWASPWFPHHLGAVDQQPSGFTYNQGFSNWTLNGSSPTYDRTKTITAGSDTYTANFKDEFNITFQNSFSDATGGVINVNGQHNAPYQTTALQDIGIDASAVTQTINGIRYDFDHWSDASTEGTNHHFSPAGHQTYTAYFVGTPLNVNRNLNFEASDPNQPITINWNDHPDSNVTYKIWRKSKYQQQATSSPQLIGSVNSDTHSFIDYEFYGTNLGFTDWKLWYDVKAYFTLEGTSSADDYAQVFSNGMIAKRVDDLEDNITVSINENRIDNYPNPFNPSTIISYQIVNAGHVTLKVYDNLGREIKTLVDREQNSGKYSINFNADNLASGIYYYRIVSNGFTAVKKMILTK